MRDSEIGEQRGVARDHVAQRARQREVVGMNLDRARRGDQIRPEVDQDVAQCSGKAAAAFGEMAIGKIQELHFRVAERRQRRARLALPLRRLACLAAVGGNDDAHATNFAQMEGHQSAAADDLVVGVRRQHQQPLAA